MVYIDAGESLSDGLLIADWWYYLGKFPKLMLKFAILSLIEALSFLLAESKHERIEECLGKTIF